MPEWIQNVLLQGDTTQLVNLSRGFSLTASEDGIILKFSISWIFKNIWLKFFLQTIIKGSVAEFIFSKIPWFQHILLGTFSRCIWSIKIILWDASCFRDSNNIITAKPSLQKLSMELQWKWKLQALFR